MTAQKYRPSNGTEGEGFICEFCGNCARSDHAQPDADDDSLLGCEITGRTMLYDVEDPEYPAEWIWDGLEPRCTAYVQIGEPLATERCRHTADMFGGGSTT
ncbi:hypothetical protein EA658_13780 [Pseudoxanthomonas winnipegensis]|uniref:Uncharacterized protein n=1 Tax=Pseudoxanthomonas winnipegensis TaxID=2480810 RepID=A0ABY1WB20_9GAMM|nr:hypothetical protein [Pseudoxanthomonas winnipegensis]TAA18213.1 hypothetical protein EA658_13780 [Pseudoxanthomonas winnipegensis]